ncbi:Rft-1-domain-containing protein [Cylindrobasidium torrendii FP15055 ss-10]|uniref:Man(5)GlcNAc(2)-PP-dolichol translocation protein RFT1 n=1 Tax=Cylindrobasidium torrendii FP15055 ss-10 TaxID=1314674 RepID=A0A0D7BNH6_9AGAR|nr:Rft-1-domain-containing protein [Cylindrobasidium torrendii FP15055 ss-10]
MVKPKQYVEAHHEPKPASASQSPNQPSFLSALPLIFLQLGSRLFSFALNQALLRIATPSAFGTATIQFELLLNTILFLSREGVRTALLRVDSSTSSRSTANVAFVPFFLGCPIALGAAYTYVSSAADETRAQPFFMEAVALYVVGALVELLKEPMHIAIMTGLDTRIRLRAEGIAVVGRSVVTLLVMYTDPLKDSPTQNRALLAFALGQAFYAVCVEVIYLLHYGAAYLYPRKPELNKDGKAEAFFDSKVIRLSASVTFQSLVKHFLTEGDKLLLSWFTSLEDQGGYAIALNYGSLIARIILQPLEETSRSIFSGLVAAKDQAGALHHLTTFLSSQVPISLILPIFGPPFIPLAAQLLLPPQYLMTSAPEVLAAWMWYIPILALNGQLEAFMASTANEKAMNRQSVAMAVFSAIYISSAVVAYRMDLGDASLVYANMLNLTIRIVYALVWTREYSRGAFSWKSLLPGKSDIAVLVSSGVLVRLLGNKLGVLEVISRTGKRAFLERPVLLHVGIGGVVGVLSLGYITRRIWRSKLGRVKQE